MANSLCFVADRCDTNRLRNYIGKEWFLDMSLKQEPTLLAKRISEVLDRPANGDGA